jgi:hypothetical protein
MIPGLRYAIVAVVFTVSVYGGDITLPLDDGSIVIRDAQFVLDKTDLGIRQVRTLSYTLVNQTSSAWRTLKLQFEIKADCNVEPHEMTVLLYVPSGGDWALDNSATKSYTQSVGRFFSNFTFCRTVEIASVQLAFAENSKLQIDGLSGERVDLEKQRHELAEAERKDAEAHARKSAIDAARRKRAAAEQKKTDAERDARIAVSRAEREAVAAEERRKIRANCTTIYSNTIDKKVKDLTVREEQQVRACQVLGLYPPQ